MKDYPALIEEIRYAARRSLRAVNAHLMTNSRRWGALALRKDSPFSKKLTRAEKIGFWTFGAHPFFSAFFIATFIAAELSLFVQLYPYTLSRATNWIALGLMIVPVGIPLRLYFAAVRRISQLALAHPVSATAASRAKTLVLQAEAKNRRFTFAALAVMLLALWGVNTLNENAATHSGRALANSNTEAR